MFWTDIAPKYLTLVLSWPVLGLVFIFWFSDDIKIFMKNIDKWKAGPFEGQQAGQTQNSVVEKKIQDDNEQANEAHNKDQQIKELSNRVRLFEFAYLNFFLVPNSKKSLMFFQTPSTKENFLISSPLITNKPIQDPSMEREVIFSVLLSNGLIEQEGQLFKISQKGIDFLKFAGLIL